MTFSLLQSNYRRNLPTDLLDYQLPRHQRELNTEYNHDYRHISPPILEGCTVAKLGVNNNIRVSK